MARNYLNTENQRVSRRTWKDRRYRRYPKSVASGDETMSNARTGYVCTITTEFHLRMAGRPGETRSARQGAKQPPRAAEDFRESLNI